MTLSVNVISRDDRYGLRQDRDILASILERSGFAVNVIGNTVVQDWTRDEFRRMCANPADFNFFCDAIYPAFFDLARRQLLLPNQEWFPEPMIPLLPFIDAVVCKSVHAREIFSELGARTVYSGFTTRDRGLPQREAPRREFLCINSSAVERILGVWLDHPEWPHLTITTREWHAQVNAPNILHFNQYLPDETILRMQHEHAFHLCVSRTEAFGHKLVEGLSCGAIVITTDGPPMNEVIAPRRGLLVKVADSEPHGIGTAFDFDVADLERTIERCIGLSVQEVEERSHNARRWFEENDRAFRTGFPELMRELA